MEDIAQLPKRAEVEKLTLWQEAFRPGDKHRGDNLFIGAEPENVTTQKQQPQQKSQQQKQKQQQQQQKQEQPKQEQPKQDVAPKTAPQPIEAPQKETAETAPASESPASAPAQPEAKPKKPRRRPARTKKAE